MSSRKKTALHGIEPKKTTQRGLLKLARRFRNAQDTKEAKRLGDKLGRMVFGI